MVAVKVFTVVFCPKQRQGNGLKLEIIGIAFLCCHFLLQIAKSTFVLSSIPLITVRGCTRRYYVCHVACLLQFISIKMSNIRLPCGGAHLFLILLSSKSKLPLNLFYNSMLGICY